MCPPTGSERRELEKEFWYLRLKSPRRSGIEPESELLLRLKTREPTRLGLGDRNHGKRSETVGFSGS